MGRFRNLRQPGDRFSLADAAFLAMLGSLDFCAGHVHVFPFDWRSAQPSLIPYFDTHQSRPPASANQSVISDYDPQETIAADSVPGGVARSH